MSRKVICVVCGKEKNDDSPLMVEGKIFSYRVQHILSLDTPEFSFCRQCFDTEFCGAGRFSYFRMARCNNPRCNRVFDITDQETTACSGCCLCKMCCPTRHFCHSGFMHMGECGTIPSFQKEHRLVGVEIELIDHGRLASSESIWKQREKLFFGLPPAVSICHDGSVHGPVMEGFELVTPPLAIDGDPYLFTMEKIEQLIKECKFEVNETCGFHVHIDARDIVKDPVLISRLLRTTYAIEDILFSMNPPSRWNNRFCESLSKNYCFEDFTQPMQIADFEQYWYSIKDKRFRAFNKSEIEHFKSNKYGHAKYSGVNFHSMMYRKTIEFRHHAGTTQKDKMMHWVTLLHHLVTYAVDHYKDKDVCELYYLDTSPNKLDRMIEVLKIPKDTASYMHERVDKFNKKFLHFKMNMAEQSSRLREDLLRKKKDSQQDSLSVQQVRRQIGRSLGRRRESDIWSENNLAQWNAEYSNVVNEVLQNQRHIVSAQGQHVNISLVDGNGAISEEDVGASAYVSPLNDFQHMYSSGATPVTSEWHSPPIYFTDEDLP